MADTGTVPTQSKGTVTKRASTSDSSAPSVSGASGAEPVQKKLRFSTRSTSQQKVAPFVPIHGQTAVISITPLHLSDALKNIMSSYKIAKLSVTDVGQSSGVASSHKGSSSTVTSGAYEQLMRKRSQKLAFLVEGDLMKTDDDDEEYAPPLIPDDDGGTPPSASGESEGTTAAQPVMTQESSGASVSPRPHDTAQQSSTEHCPTEPTI